MQTRSFCRRDLLAGSLGAALAMPLGAQTASPVRKPGGGLRLGIASRHLQWTSIDDAIALAVEIGFTSIEWSVRSGSHIPPDQARALLPSVVARTRGAGLAVDIISANILDADPASDAIVGAASASGVRLYRGAAAYRWDASTDRLAQLNTVKRRIEAVGAMNARHGATIAYHTYSGAGMIGGNLWDLWTVLRTLDPATVGFNYDLAHGLARNGPGWRDALAVAVPYVHAISAKDFLWKRGERGWQPEWVPLGDGMVDLPASFRAIAEMGKPLPLTLQVEHHGLLGADVGTGTLRVPRAEFVAILKRDVAALTSAHAAGSAA